jgi:O-methyltransferase
MWECEVKKMRGTIIEYINRPLINTMIDSVRLMNLYHLLSQTIVFDVPGDVVELGCHEGCASVLIKMVLESHHSAKHLHLYDSFEGLPAWSEQDEGSIETKDNLRGSERRLLRNFRRYRLGHPIVHRGWFQDTLPQELPESISFAHLDGDLYSSVKESLEAVYPRMSRNGVVLVDDYDVSKSACYPGCAKAVQEFLREKPETIEPLHLKEFYVYSAHGFIRKQ